MHVLIRPAAAPGSPIDVTHALVSAISSELARAGVGDNDTLNWLEAERLLDAMLSRTIVGPCPPTGSAPRCRCLFEDRPVCTDPACPEHLGRAGLALCGQHDAAL